MGPIDFRKAQVFGTHWDFLSSNPSNSDSSPLPRHQPILQRLQPAFSASSQLFDLNGNTKMADTNQNSAIIASG
jgi:hypothetical protein